MPSAMERVLVVGCRTTVERDAHGSGLATFVLDGGGRVRRVGHVTTVNPSFVVADPRYRIVHAVHGDGHEVSSYRIGPGGEVTEGVTRSCEGRNPAHLAWGPGRAGVLVANHSSGSVASLPVGPDGLLADPTSVLDGLDGPHQVLVDAVSELALVPDKRADAIHVVALAGDGALRLLDSCPTPAGAGPRHALLDGTRGLLHVLDELSSTISTYWWDPGARARLGLLSRVPTLPPDADVGQWRAAELAWSPGRGRLLASNRSGAGDDTPGGPDADTIVELSIDAATGLPGSPTWHSTHGIRPRHFLVEGTERSTVVWVANERSDTVVRLHTASGGRLVPDTTVTTGSPTCLAWMEA
ncbi:putative hemagglutinin-related protein [Nostocoides japonicum T1-X7]|uniref:Putative hemagglutinin-related protein n=1 Tax=Nostocoides japonicum T1-X7 TaxID=1194083 RepID=A0A077M0J7_9MICO|nr:beta-propeller fold lactonase family protein [Tetrasphaera japonica]CCH78627.1 putative hemagglutinin-related protein [Tetrasphaera japonica T1-X7]